MNRLTQDCILWISEKCDPETANNLRIALSGQGNIIYNRLKPTCVLSKIVLDVSDILYHMKKYNVVLGGEKAYQYFNPEYDASSAPWRFYCKDHPTKFKEYLESKGYKFARFECLSDVIYKSDNIFIISVAGATSIESMILSHSSIYQCCITSDYSLHANWNLSRSSLLLQYIRSRNLCSEWLYKCSACRIKRYLECSYLDDITMLQINNITKQLKDKSLSYDLQNVFYKTYKEMLEKHIYPHDDIDIYDVHCYINNIHRCRLNLPPEYIPESLTHHIDFYSKFNISRLEYENFGHRNNSITYKIRDRSIEDNETLMISHNVKSDEYLECKWIEAVNIHGGGLVDFVTYECLLLEI